MQFTTKIPPLRSKVCNECKYKDDSDSSTDRHCKINHADKGTIFNEIGLCEANMSRG